MKKRKSEKKLEDKMIRDGFRRLTVQERWDLYLKSLKEGEGIVGISRTSETTDEQMHEFFNIQKVARWTTKRI